MMPYSQITDSLTVQCSTVNSGVDVGYDDWDWDQKCVYQHNLKFVKYHFVQISNTRSNNEIKNKYKYSFSSYYVYSSLCLFNDDDDPRNGT